MRYLKNILLLVLLISGLQASAQSLYSARGYWEESSKPNYQSNKQKQLRGDSLTKDQTAYLADYEAYLDAYFQRLDEVEKLKYAAMKDQWSRERSSVANPSDTSTTNFEYRNRDRFKTALYGFYYAGSFAAIAGLDNGAGITGLALITSGLMLLSPAIFPKKYEGISQNTIRAQNTGRFLGAIYGAGLGLTLAGSDNGKFTLGASALSSLVMGEVAFQIQKKKKIGRGQIEMMRHYGIVMPLVGLSLMGALHVDNVNTYGVAILGGGVAGLFMGRNVSRKYEYSKGDVDAISSLSIISGSLGFATVATALENNENSNALILIPATTALLGTIVGQRQVRGVHLTSKQGSTLNLASAGAALVGLGAVAIAQSNSPAVYLGVASGLALITHQVVFNKFKKKNLTLQLKAGENKNPDFNFSFNLTPENYFLNKKFASQSASNQTGSRFQNPLFNIRLTF